MERSTRGRGRGGRGRGRAPVPARPTQVTSRAANWPPHETSKLLSAIREVQLKVNKSDLKLTDPEWNQVLEKFHQSGDFGTRTLANMHHRIKVVRGEYSMIKELLGRSGWAWDNEKHMVVAPTPEAWNEICKDGKKWKHIPNRSFPYYDELCQIIGNSCTTGEYGVGSIVREKSQSGSSSGAWEHDEVPQDSDERARFDFQTFHAAMEVDGVQQPVPNEVPNVGHPSVETSESRTASSRTSNKRKSSDTGEGSRSQRVKRTITKNQQHQENLLTEVRELANSGSRLAQVGEEFVSLQRKKLEVPSNIMEALSELVLHPDDLIVAMRALQKPIEQQIFMFGGQQHRINYLNKIIPGFMQRNVEVAGQNAQYSPFFNSGYFGQSPM